jgi:NIMA (never in mitosis gene a)-related kinase
LYELCTFKHPFEARSQGALILKILNNKPEPISSTFSKELNNIIYMLLDKNYDKRPSCIEILKNNMVIDKIKNLGLSELLTDLDNISTDNSSTKINKPINIRKIYYEKNNINNEKKKIINS